MSKTTGLPEGLRATGMKALDDCMRGNDRDALDQLWQRTRSDLLQLEPKLRRLIDLIHVAKSVKEVENGQR